MSSNCNRFRFLIQQQFDTDLSPQDERMLISHVDQCESCAKFQHQLQQVIMAAEDVPLPEELLPPNPEALARTIMSQLPEQKSGMLSKLLGPILSMFSGKKAAAQDRSGSAFPHINRASAKANLEEQSTSGGGRGRPTKGQREEDHTGTTTRLRNIAARATSDDNRELQSHTKSLSEKMGFSAPSSGMDDQPLTLAESIRKKISESQKTDEAPMLDPQPLFEPEEDSRAAASTAKPPANMADPPNITSQQPKQQVPMPLQQNKDAPVGPWGKPMDTAQSWGPGGAGAPAAEPQGNEVWGSTTNPPASAPAQPGGDATNWGGTWNEPPRGSQPGDKDSDWGPPPQGGTWDDPNNAPGSPWSGGPGGPTPAIPVPQVQPAPPPTPAPAPAPQAPAANAPPAGWGAPAPVATPPAGGDPWGPTQNSWGQPAAQPAWGSQPQAPAPAADAAPPVTPPQHQTGGWGQQPAATQQDAWGQTPPAPPQQQQTGGWGQAPQAQVQPQAESATWGQTPAAPSDNGAWAQTGQPPKDNGGWGQPQKETGGWTPAPEQQDANWVQPDPDKPAWAQPAQPAEPTTTWNQTAPQGGDNGWAQNNPDPNWGQPPQPAQQPGAMWGAPTGQQPPAVEPARGRERASYNIDAEQVETGTWRAFQPVGETLGATPAANWSQQAAAAAAPGAPGGRGFAPSTENPSRWDVPIQERMKVDQAAPPAPPAPAQAEPQMTPPAQAWAQAPQAAPPPGTAGGGGGAPNTGWGPAPEWGQTGENAQPQAAPASVQWQAPQQQQQPQAPAPSNAWAQQAAAPQAQASAAPQALQAATPPGLFQGLDDRAIDKLFSENLGINDSAQSVSVPPTAPPPAQGWTDPNQPMQGQQQHQAAPGQNQYIAPDIAPGLPQAPNQVPQGAPAPEQMGAPRISPVQSRATGQGMPAQPDYAQAQIPVPEAANQQQEQKGLFQLDDTAMDKLFSENLGVTEAVVPVGAARPAAAAAAPPAAQGNPFANIQAPPVPQGGMPPPQGYTPPPPQQQQPGAIPPPQAPWPSQGAPQQQQQPQGGGLFAIDDSVIDRIFADNMGIKPDQPAGSPQINVNDAVRSLSEAAQNQQQQQQQQPYPPPPPPPYQQQQQQQQPSSPPMPPPKIEGVGRLDTRAEAVEGGSGRIASIGKFLLDQKDLEKIGKLTASDVNDSKMRILTLEAASELQTLLQHIGMQKDVVGSVIVGHDGLLIANTMPPDIDAESVGVWALGVYMNTEHVIKKMGQDRVHQIVSRTPKGYLVIADFGGGLLVTVSDGKDTDTLIPLMRSITQLVAQ